MLPANADRVLIAVNPTAGRGAGFAVVDQLVSQLGRRGMHAEIGGDLDEVVATCHRWQKEGRLRALVAAGGDGTAAELVNRTEADVPIGLLPLGTENLLAKYLGLLHGKNPVQSLCETIVAGTTVRFDAGRASGRIFLLMASCGFDADVVRRLHSRRRGPIRHWDYAQPILQSIRSYEYPELRVYCRGIDQSGAAAAETLIRARWLFSFNLPCYARGLTFTPDAIGTDGLLDVCTFARGSLWHGLRYLSSVVRGSHPRLVDVHMVRVRSLRVESDQPVAYQLDGDAGGTLPLDIDVLPRRARLIVPEAWVKWHADNLDKPQDT